MTTETLGGYVTLDGAAQALGSTKQTIYGFVKRHQIPTLKIGRSMLVKLADIKLQEGSSK